MLNIIWSDDAVDDVLENIDYLEKHWTKKEVDTFSEEIDAVLDKLSVGNLTFKPCGYKNTYEVPIIKQITLYYQVQDNDILLVRFWNNYRNPDNLVIK
ncbi:type II toxin-antitoxin system RelE/ParE family toxin [Flavobacterium gawalongense]|uniref:Type II toxin-antitoxin system RelE/ParE family toxin n=1 Tax=Flavobacterium gawalongense TaxID=2594432 RepID=A0ABY3CF86_9FLAO|nr:type II toxin-antitoxin system RelE/ParE family toxin [Flavobacterium gawalongense]TRX01663.1 type II toxin-antitoxin system RelE/ParE family toxin [Flavobacterium gawalongense]